MRLRSGFTTAGRVLAVTILAVTLATVVDSIEPVPAQASTQGDQIAAAAASQAGVAYCDGGGGINGPTHGAGDAIGCAGTTVGFDCMSLVQYAVYQVTGIALPGDGSQLPGVGTVIPADDTAALLPGDAVFWGGSGLDSFEHSGIYAGNGEVWDAISAGNPVQQHSMTYLESVYTYDGAIRFWSTPPGPSLGVLPGPVVGMAATPDGGGYWLADAEGGVSPHGSATPYGSMAGRPLNAPIAHIVATPDGKGYWLVASDGGIFNFGDAGFFGSMGGQHLNAPVVDIAPTTDGKGYWLVASDGGVFAFGDATFKGSMGGIPINKPVVGIATDGTGGYWEVATDGGIFAFGAPFLGSTGSLALNQPVNGMAPTAHDAGYLLVASDGGTFAFGDAAFHGSTAGLPLNAPIVGVALDRASGGYWLVGADGGIFAFDAPFYGAD
jgi:NlpC/P60 family